MIAVRIIIPMKQIFAEGIEIERVPHLAIFAEVFEGHGQPCFTGAVVGIEHNELFWLRDILQLLAQIGGEGIQVWKWSCAHASASSGDGKSCCTSPFFWSLVRRAFALGR